MTTFAISDNLDWTVSTRPLFYAGNEGTPVKWEERVAVVRDDNGICLGAVSPTYETVQNSDLLSLIDPMVQEGLLQVETMGHLNHGARVFAQAKINQEFQVIGEDYTAYVLASAPCSAGQFQKAVEKIYQKDAKNLRNIETLNHLFYNGAGNEGRTLYDAFNSVTDFGSNRSRKTEAGKFNYVQFGQGSRINQRAMRVLTEMATV